MNQPPDQPYYDSPTENTPLPPQWQQGQYPQQAPSPNYPPPAYPPNPGSASQPGFSPPPQGYPQQGSATNYPAQPGAYPGQQPGPGGYPGQPGPGGYPGQPPQQGGQYGVPPSWPNMAQPPQKPKRSNVGCIITSVILIVVLLIGGGATFAFVRNQQANATPTAGAGTQTVKVTVTPTKSAGITPTITLGGSTGTVGQPIQAGTTWIATVTKATTTTASSFPPKPGQTYLEISMSLKNITTSTQVVSSLLEFTLKDTSGASYNETLTDTNVTKTIDGNVAAGQTLVGQIAFEVPQSAHTFLFSFTYGLVEGSTGAISWPITV